MDSSTFFASAERSSDREIEESVAKIEKKRAAQEGLDSLQEINHHP
jgi:hypothetical protein